MSGRFRIIRTVIIVRIVMTGDVMRSGFFLDEKGRSRKQQIKEWGPHTPWGPHTRLALLRICAGFDTSSVFLFHSIVADVYMHFFDLLSRFRG